MRKDYSDIDFSVLAKIQGSSCMCTREPGGTLIGDQVRSILTRLDNTVMAPEAELCLFLASRAQLVKEVVVPAFSAGTIVLCDRFTDARLAYQGYGHGLDVQFLKSLNMFATGGLVPDMTVFVGRLSRDRNRASSFKWRRVESLGRDGNDILPKGRKRLSYTSGR